MWLNVTQHVKVFARRAVLTTISLSCYKRDDDIPSKTNLSGVQLI